MKALGGCAQATLSKNTPQRKSASVHPTGNRASLLQPWNLEPNHLAMFAFERVLIFQIEIKIRWNNAKICLRPICSDNCHLIISLLFMRRAPNNYIDLFYNNYAISIKA